jgi:hypothetical protein
LVGHDRPVFRRPRPELPIKRHEVEVILQALLDVKARTVTIERLLKENDGEEEEDPDA